MKRLSQPDLDGNKIVNLGDPDDPQDATPKSYVDAGLAPLDAIRTSTIGLADSNAMYECGATDHDVTFQDVVDDMETAIGLTGVKQRLLILPGEYDQIEQVIVIQPKYADKIYIEGNERVTLKKTASAGGGSKIFGENAPTYSTTPGSDWLDFAYRGMLGFHLKNVTLDGNGANNSSGSPISLNGCQDFNLVDVTIYDGKNFQSYVKGAKGVQIYETDDVTEAEVTAVKGSHFISGSNVDFTAYVTVGDKLRIATTATPDNTGGSDADYAFDSADVIEVTTGRIQLAAPWPHQDVSGRQVRFFKPNEVNSMNLHYENRTGFTGTDDSWGGGAFNGHLFNIEVIESGGYGIGMTGSGGFIVDGVRIRGGVKGIGTERCYGRTRVSNFSIIGCSSAGLWTVNGNFRIYFSNGTISDCDGNGIDEKVVVVGSDGGTIKAGNIGVVYDNVLILNSGVHGARITGDGTELINVKSLNNARISTGGGIVLASDTNGSQTTNATNVRLVNVEGFDTRVTTDRTQNYGLWIVSGAGANLYTQNVAFHNNTTSDTFDQNGTARTINFRYDKTNNRMTLGEIWAEGKIHNVTDPTSAQDAATKAYVDASVTGLLDFKGSTDASANPNYPSASKGDTYVVSVAGKVGGASGKSVDVGDFYIATADNAGGTEASVGTSWTVLEHNLSMTNLPLTTPQITTSINDVNGNPVLGIVPTGSANSYLQLTNAASGGTITLAAVALAGTPNFILKGSGIFALRPTTNSANAVRIQDAAGSTTVLSADTTNSRVGINKTSPTETLDVAGTTKSDNFKIDNALADDSTSGTIADFVAAENLVFGDVCYINSAGKMAKADADAIATAGAVAIARASISTDATGSFLLTGIIRDDSAYAFTIGGTIYLSTTPGGITQTAPSATDA